MFSREFQSGDPVIFSAIKHGPHPGPRAKEIRPEPNGEAYAYAVDKFWIVTENRGGQVRLMTRRGKVHLVDVDDPRLHRASWWQRLVYRGRFPKPQELGEENQRLA